jgi:hypothetical protein
MTQFFKGRHNKEQRAQYKQVRKSLQQKQTASADKHWRKWVHENRWMTYVNHPVSKVLVEQAGKNSLIAMEDLEGVRSATEKVRK